VPDALKLSKELIVICINLLENISGLCKGSNEKSSMDLNNVYTIPNFLLLSQELCKLAVADASGLSKMHRVAFFLNIYQVTMTYKKVMDMRKG
jgi:hypothetical protein